MPPEAILARLHGLHPRLIDLSLDRLRRLLADLGNPHLALPPVLHVAGTNGKGSTCAFLRAMAEAAGLTTHVYTSPHLVRFNERIRLAGRIVDDDTLSAAFEEVERVNQGASITVFEVITATAFLLFARTPADLAILEVGLGGRGDATNIIEHPAACAIASLSLDHQELLGDTIEAIAAEKAGIMKPGVPVVTGLHPPAVRNILRGAAEAANVTLLEQGRDWHLGGTTYTDAAGTVPLPVLGLPGTHQRANAALAVAAIRAASLPIPSRACTQGAASAQWPARLQRLTGKLAALLPPGCDLWLDGGHNQGAAQILEQWLAGWSDRPIHLIVGMKRTKDPAAFLAPLLPHASTIWAVAEPGQHDALDVPTILAASNGRARPGPTVAAALAAITEPGRVLICGSLHLAGEVLKADQSPPG